MQRPHNKPIKPQQVFNADGGWGAWQLLARHEENNIENAALSTASSGSGLRFADPRINANAAKTWQAGVNWHLNQSVKVALNYDRTSFNGGGQVKMHYSPDCSLPNN